MDATEKLVHDHLAHRGFTNIVYEPDGNIPPDFLVDGCIAIEARRLNKHHFSAEGAKGLEELAIPFWRKVKGLLASLGPPIKGESWFVDFTFSRPVEPWKTLKPALRSALQAFIASSTQEREVIATAQGFELAVFGRTSKPHRTMFILAGCSDKESGGWLLADMGTNIQHCASEKSRKIANVQSKYPQWWLALVDHIGYGLDNFDREMFRDQVSIEHSWDKIIIIDPRDHTRWFEI